jgi:hypothetical protein
LLSIIFLAAVIGIAKPYLGKLTRTHFAGIAVLAFIGIMVVVSTSKTSQTTAAGTSGSTPAADKSANTTTPESPTAKSETDKPETKWSYRDRKDEMRGTSSHEASVTSENTVDLDFPYGEQQGEITVRRDPKSGLNVMFSVEKGQIICNNITNTTISVKFDDGPVQKLPCTDASDGSNNVAFFTNGSRMLAGLKKAKRTVIEAEFFQKGNQQFVFTTAGFEWK